jgi:hypothetical protein
VCTFIDRWRVSFYWSKSKAIPTLNQCKRTSRGFVANARRSYYEGEGMGLILFILLIVLLIGAIPAWPHSRNWGYFPSGGLGLVLLVVVVLLLSGRMHM